MVVDAVGRNVPISTTPLRIVSLVPSLTEYLFDIGVGDRVVGVTDYCIAPAEAVASLPKLRGTKNPDRAGILALQPDLVLAAKEENRERDIRALEAAGVPVYVTDIQRVADTVEQLGALAHILDADHTAAPLLNELRATLAECSPHAEAPRRRMLTFIWRDPWMAVGGDTYADDLLRLCGAENSALEFPGRYPRAPLAEFMRLEPDVILLPNEPYCFTDADRAAFDPFADVTAVQLQHVYLCDGMLLTWYGARTITAFRVFSELLTRCG